MPLERVEVNASHEAQYHAIDRKVYHVGRDIQSATGTVSDLLQNIPSLQVDIEGNVSLRGDASVLILIDGKPSALTLENGQIYRNAFGLDPLVISRTLEEVGRCKRQGIMINTQRTGSRIGAEKGNAAVCSR